MKHKTIQNKKVFEERLQEEICNFNPQAFNTSDAHESGRTRENTMENTNNNSNAINNNSLMKDSIFNTKSKKRCLNKSSSREREKGKKSSRKSSKNSLRDSNSFIEPQAQSSILTLVDSLKEKIEFYENEMRNLIDEKIQMQMTINNLQIQQMKMSTNNSRNLKSKDNSVNTVNKSALISENNKVLRISHESVFDFQNQSRNEERTIASNKINNSNRESKSLIADSYTNNNLNKSANEAKAKRQNSITSGSNNNNNIELNNNSHAKELILNNHQENITRQKRLLESNNSILDDTINVNTIKEFEERLSFGLNPENENDQIVFLRLQYENQKKKEYELEKSKSEAKNALLDLEKQKFFMLSEINNLKDELQSLMEMQQQIMNYREESGLLEKSQNLLTSNINNCISTQQIQAENDACKNGKNNSFDNKCEKSNFYLPTCETYKKGDITTDEQLYQNLTTNRIRYINNINHNNTNSYITYNKSDLNRCFIQEANNEKTISNNQDNNTKIFKESHYSNCDNNNILNISEIEASITPNKSLINCTNKNYSNALLKQKASDFEKATLNKSKTNFEFNGNLNQKNTSTEIETNSILFNNNYNSFQCENNDYQNHNISINNINCGGNFNNNTNNNNSGIGLPSIENFFIFKEKVFLVDNEKNVWHLKKCKRFDKTQKDFFREKNISEEKYNNNNHKLDNDDNFNNYRNQIFNNFLDFYQNHENEKNIDLRENHQSNNLLKENDIHRREIGEAYNECRSTRTILNNSNLSKNFNSSFLHSLNAPKKTNDLNIIYKDNTLERSAINKTLNSNLVYVENESNYILEAKGKKSNKAIDLIEIEKSNDKSINVINNFENPDNTITSMDLVSEYSRKCNREWNENSNIMRNMDDTKDERIDFQDNYNKKNSEDMIEHEKNSKKNKEADKDTTYNLSDDSI